MFRLVLEAYKRELVGSRVTCSHSFLETNFWVCAAGIAIMPQKRKTHNMAFKKKCGQAEFGGGMAYLLLRST
jgi:hypothetical protein